MSAPKVLEGPRGEFKVKNYNDSYAGVTTLAGATTTSDNSVYAEVGYKLVGTSAVARVARRMGVRTPISQEPVDGPRRPQGGRDAARDGEVLRDARAWR